MTSSNTVILGYDAVSPLGGDMDTQWRRAMCGQSGVDHLTRFEVTQDFPVQIAGQVADINATPYPFLSPRNLANWTSPVFKYGMLVVHRALERSGIDITPDVAPRVAVTFSSAVGGQDAVLAADRRMMAQGKLPHPFTTPNACINMVGGKISMLTGATGPITATVTACATGLTSMLIGSMLLEQGRADVAICGAVDFALVAPIVAGFATMNGAYVPRPEQIHEAPARASRPFSVDRRGFVISEGAGSIIIATKDFAHAHGLTYSVALAGWDMTSDARHFVAPNFETVRRCMAQAVDRAGIAPGDIDAVNAHAASTRVGDQVEADALRAVFEAGVPPVSANKSMIGHAMGASSAIEAIFAMAGMQQNRLLPTINHTPDPKIPLDCVAEGVREVTQEFVLKNAFGFGGCNSCAVFKRTA